MENKLYTKQRNFFKKVDDEDLWWAFQTLTEDDTLIMNDIDYKELSVEEREELGMAVIDLYYERKLNTKDYSVAQEEQLGGKDDRKNNE